MRITAPVVSPFRFPARIAVSNYRDFGAKSGAFASDIWKKKKTFAKLNAPAVAAHAHQIAPAQPDNVKKHGNSAQAPLPS